MSTFSDPEQFLLQQWTDACLLEDAMEAVRSKYKALVEQIVEEFTKINRGLDYSKIKITAGYSGVAVGRTSWPKNQNGWPTGFYLEALRLENLISPEEERPYRIVSVFLPDADPKQAQEALRNTAKSLLSKEELDRLVFDPPTDDWASCWCYLEQTREELLELMLKNKARGFVDAMVAQFTSMAKFTSVVDEIVTQAAMHAKSVEMPVEGLAKTNRRTEK